MSSFMSPLVVSPLPDGKNWELQRSFSYHVDSRYSTVKVTVPRYFITDFASIPKFLWWLPYWAKFNKAAVLHDYLYTTRFRPTRREADRIFYEAMLISFQSFPLGKLIARLEYTAVRLAGGLAWHRKGRH